MRKLFVCLTGLTALLLVVAPEAEGQKKAENKKNVVAEPASSQDYAALNQAKDLEGRILAIDATTKGLTVRVEFKHLEPNIAKGGKGGKDNTNQQFQNQLRQQQQFYREYDQIMRLKNPAQQQMRMQQLWAKMQMQAAKSNLKNFPKTMPGQDAFKVVTTAKEYQLETADAVRVARTKLPTEYDDKGNVKEYTQEELKKLKDTVLAGYKSKFEDVEPGMLVKLYLARPKAPAKEKPAAKADKPAEGEEKAEDKGEKKPADAVPNTPINGSKSDNRPQVSMILIESDPDPSFLPKKKEEKKKKKN